MKKIYFFYSNSIIATKILAKLVLQKITNYKITVFTENLHIFYVIKLIINLRID
jgi:hypothetical protein